MRTSCPTCGAEVEFRHDDSFVRVCGHCRAAVVRTDRGVDTLGKVADLAPSSSPLELWLEGRLPDPDGGKRGLGFMLIGHAQIRHGAGGIWDEWYAKLDDGRWGWLAEAQGRFYFTFETFGAGEVPGFDEIEPGDKLTLEDEGRRVYHVAEKGVAEYLACDGEIPYRFVPGGTFRFVDLGDGLGRAGTIDYGDPDDTTPAVYLGRQVTLDELGWGKREAAGRQPPRIASGRLACPSCDGSLELRAPDRTMRIGCPYCGSLIDTGEGTLAVIAQQGKRGHKPLWRLGSKATFDGVEYTLIGYLRRQAQWSGMLFPFDEYLLYEPRVGFRWLVESDGHWSFVTTLPAGAAEVSPINDGHATYRGVDFRKYDANPIDVVAVHGEVYWKVEVGEHVHGVDYVAPPAMLSSERTGSEVNWSLGVYTTPDAVVRAFGRPPDGDLPLPRPQGVGPHQPFRHRGLGAITGLGLLGLLLVAGFFFFSAGGEVVHRESFAAASAEPAPDLAEVPTAANVAVYFSQELRLSGGLNVEVELAAPLENQWMVVGVDLVNVDSGHFTAFDVLLERWSGVEDGESYTEGDRRVATNLSAMPAGRYVVRLEVQLGDAASRPLDATILAPTLELTVRQDVFRTLHFLIALGVIGVPGIVLALWALSFERRRWKNSAYAPAHLSSDDGDDE